MKRLMAGILLSSLVLGSQVHAEINKCRGADGNLYYTDQRCPSHTTLESSELTAEEKREQLREEQRKNRQKQAAAEEEARLEKLKAQLDYEESKKKQRVNYLRKLLDQGKITQLEYITIQQKGIFIGMGELALRESWGNPSSINRNGLGSDQWVYNVGVTGRRYAYVEDGKVTNWQTTE